MKNLITFITLLFFTFNSLAQTSYTWNGGTSTDFATGTNWTPNGVPGSGDNITIVTGSNTCKLDGNRTVNNLTMTSGTLDLETYTITVGNNSTLNGGTVEDGGLTMSSGTAKFAGTTMDCKVDVTANITQVYDTHFKDSVALDETDASGYYMRGCIFDDYVEITNSSTGWVRTGNNQPDTFRLKAVFNLEAAGNILLGHGATTNHFEDDVVLNNNSGSTTKGFHIGGNANAVVDFLGDIEMNVTTGSGLIKFNLGTITHHGALTIGSQGYHSGTLTLKGYRQNSAVDVDLSSLSNNARIELGPNLELEGNLTCPSLYTRIWSGCEFNGDVTIADLRAWEGAIFNGVTDLTITVGNVYTGGNMFNDTARITNNGTGYFGNGDNDPDTFNLPVTFNLEAAGYILLGNDPESNYYADKVTLNNHSGHSGRYIRVGAHASVNNVFDGDIELNVDASSGNIDFWLGTTHNGLLTIGSEGYNNETLTLRNYEQTANGTIDLSTMDSDADLDVLTGADITADFIYGGGGTATLTDAVFQGDVTIESSSLPVTDCAFHGTTYLEKTGGVNNLNDGNTFYGPVTIENSSTSNYLYWGNAVADTFLMDLTLINRSTQPLWINYSSEGEIGGDLTLDGDSASVIRLGGSAAGRITVFNGSSNQNVSILEEDLDVQVYRMEVDKSGGRLLVDGILDISHELGLTDGIIGLEESDMLILQDGVEPTATDTSHVEGKVRKIGNDAYEFPVGRNGVYRPIGISAPSSATDAFTAEYLQEDSDPIYSHSSKAGSLDYLSTNEYWTLTRDAGTSTPEVTLSWDTLASCSMTGSLSLVHVAGWNGTQWDDLGNGSTTGNVDKGTVTTSSGVSDFTAFTIEQDNIVDCYSIDLSWSTDTVTVDSLHSYYIEANNVPSFFTTTLSLQGGAAGAYPGIWDNLELVDTVEAAVSLPYTIGTFTAKAYLVNHLGYRVDSVTYNVPYKRVGSSVFCDCEPVECDHILNGGFEEYVDLPDSYSDANHDLSCWNKAIPYGGDPGDDCAPIEEHCYEQGSTADYYHSNSSFPVSIPTNASTTNSVNTVNGNAYAGIIAQEVWDTPYNAEYLSQDLSESLVAGRTYNLKLYVQLSTYSTSAFAVGIVFTESPVCQVADGGWDHLNVTSLGQPYQFVDDLPDPNTGHLIDLNEWHSVEITFTADDDWSRLTLGNFTSEPLVNNVNVWTASGTSQTNPSAPMFATDCYWFIDEVSLEPVAPTITQGTSITVCESDLPVTLTATGSGNGSGIYTWSASPTDASLSGQSGNQEVEVSPGLGTTSYTVTVNGPNGCELTDEIDVTVVAASGFTIQGPNRTCEPTDDHTFSVSGLTGVSSYNWDYPVTATLEGGGTTSDNYVTISDVPATAGYTIELTVIYSNGCEVTEVFEVEPCCVAGVDHFEDVDVAGLGGLVVNDVLSTEIAIVGTLTINDHLTFQGTSITPLNIWLYPGASIEVDGSYDLASNYTIFDAACNEVWDEIAQTEATGSIDLRNSTIRNSEYGVSVSNGCDVTLKDNIFEFNAWSHLVIGFGDYSSAEIEGNTFRCSASPQENPNPMWGGNGVPGVLPNPTNGTDLRTRYSVVVVAAAVSFGDNNQDQNVIMDSNYGITGSSYGLTCHNTKFDNIVKDDSDGPDIQVYPDGGFSILRNEFGNDPDPIYDRIIIDQCEFTDSDHGIRGKHLGRGNTITDTDFTNIYDPDETEDAPFCANDPKSKGTAMWFSGSDWASSGSASISSGTYLIERCTITDASYGIRALGIEAGFVRIKDNTTIEWAASKLDNGGPLRGFGIHINNSSVSNTNFNIEVANCTITNAWRGIHLQNVNGIDPQLQYYINDDVWIHDNEIELHQPEHDAGLCWAPYAGLQIDNAGGVTVEENHIYSDVNYDWDWTATGIRSYNNDFSHFLCNELHDLGDGIYIIENNTWTQMMTNRMYNLLTGVVYQRGITGNQGNSSNGNGNRWEGTEWNAPGWELSGYSPSWMSDFDFDLSGDWYVGTSFPFYLSNVEYFGNILNPFTINPGGQVPLAQDPVGLALDECGDAVYPRSDSIITPHRDTIYLGLINDTIPTSLEDSTLHWNKYFSLYRLLLADTAVTNLDTVLANLVDSLHTTDIGVVHRTFGILGDTATSTSTYTSYKDSLNKESSAFHASQNLIDHLEWLTDLRANEDTLEATDVDDLISLAEKCPASEGFVVMLARAMLNTVDSLSFIEWTDTCELRPDSIGPGPSFRIASEEDGNLTEEEVLTTDKVLVYPNPATDEVTIVLPEAPEKPWHVELTAVSGTAVHRKQLYDRIQQINLSGISGGLYYLRIHSENQEQRYAEKLVIVHE